MTKKKPFKKPVRSGTYVSINNAQASGHVNKIKVHKNGNVNGASITHASKTRGRKNIPLQKNPQKKHKEKAYVVKKQTKAKVNNVGKIHKDYKVTNAVDKSILRHILKKKK